MKAGTQDEREKLGEARAQAAPRALDELAALGMLGGPVYDREPFVIACTK